ncbi:MAG: 30S ribosomal protein S8 [Alphaproteobacteria bacterium]|jgi:small subunit ribosomal protein S8
MLTDPIADVLTTIRNGQHARLAYVSSPSSKFKKDVLQVLKEEGFIKDFVEEEVGKNKKVLKITLSYYNNDAVIQDIKRISKPGVRIYSTKDKLPKVRNGLGIAIVSTSKGVMADYKAREQNLGGEIICSIF